VLQRKARRIRGLFLQLEEHKRRLVPVVVCLTELERPRHGQPDHLSGCDHLPTANVCPALCQAPSGTRVERDVAALPLGDLFFLGECPPDAVARCVDFCADYDPVGSDRDVDHRY
jgi:hypothetical protein